jgi:AraC family transcriptional regulator of adaptative response/methylated-DNA-[protein]-cysteine methyltransferase
MTFLAYHRARRLGSALEEVQEGRAVSRAAFEAGYDSLSGFQEAFRQTFGAAPTELQDALVIRVDHVPTPLGVMAVGASERALHLVEFADRRHLDRQIRRTTMKLGAVFAPGPSARSEEARRALDRYFAGHGEALSELVTEPSGTPFQKAVWAVMREIPPSETRSYAEVAESVGRPASVRAVGTAVGANPLAIVVPCHRVVGSDGKLTGYAGGLWRKRRLLELERAAADGVG